MANIEEKEVLKEEPKLEEAVEKKQQEESEQKEEKKPSKRSEKKAARKGKKVAKLKKRFFKPNDIKYQGPLSYRYLRIFAWIALAAGQILVFNTVSNALFKVDAINKLWQGILGVASNLSTPFFIIASFGIILSNQKRYRNILLTYGVAFLGMGLGICLFYYRYINGVLVKMGLGETFAIDLIQSFLGSKVQVNVFADLFAFALFHFFLNYTPEKHFKGKKIYILRAFLAIPVSFVIASYVLRIKIALAFDSMPFYIYPFLTTKAPLIFMVFCLASLWIKNRERIFIKLGATKTEYEKYLTTKRNSLAFSIQLSLIFLSTLLLEGTLFVILFIIYAGIKGYPAEMFSMVLEAYGVGDSLNLLFTIPFVLLYSYTRKHKEGPIDVVIPIAGIGLIAFVYIEGIYQLIIRTLSM